MSCPVCFGGEDTVARESLNAGIGVLLGVTGLVLACLAAFFVRLARLARQARGREAVEERLAAAGLPGRAFEA